MNRLLGTAAVATLLLLTACAGLPESTRGTQAWNEHRARLDALDHFTASGKIALRTAEQAESASLVWQQQGAASHLQLSGPMGLAATTIDSDGRQLEIRRGEEYSRWDIDDPDMDGTPAWNLPLKALPHWLKGAPAPGLPLHSLQLDDQGQLPQQFQQQGWTVVYESFGSFESFQLPTRLRVFRHETSARIILRQWQDLGPL